MIFLSLLLPFLIIPMIGLGIDGAVCFTVKAKMQTAVDAAALAAAQSLSAGQTLTAQQQTIALTADEFIRANFIPAWSGYSFWGATNLLDYNCTGSTATTAGQPTTPAKTTTYGNGASNTCIVLYQDPATKQRTVSIAASVTVPLRFMQMLGFSSQTVTARGTAARRSVVLELVIDRSGSIVAEMSALQTGALYFVSQFVPNTTLGGTDGDKLGLVLVSGSSMVAYPPTDWNKTAFGGPNGDFKSASVSPNMNDSLNNMVSSGGNTGTAEGLWLAYKGIQAANLPGALNVIVLWTDGSPNGITVDLNGGALGSATNYLTGVSGCAVTDDSKFVAGLRVQVSTGAFPYFNPGKSLLGWLAQWGNYAAGAQNVLGPFVPAQYTSGGTSPHFLNQSTVTDWVEATSLGKNAAGHTKNDNANGTHNNESLVDMTAGVGAANGCLWQGGAAADDAVSNPNGVVTYLKGIPNVDYYGDSTTGCNAAGVGAPYPGCAGSLYTATDYTQSVIWTNSAQCNGTYGASATGKYGTGGNPLKLSGNTTQGAGHPLAGDACQFGLASWNAADMAGLQIHSDAALTPVIYTMGYNGSGGGRDAALLSRLANVPSSVKDVNGHSLDTVYNAAIPSGLYLPIDSVDQVQPAFQQILAEVLRLAQ